MGRLYLVRHGQSVWNLQNRFTGWIDVSLSPKGVAEAQRAGELLAEVRFDVAFTSTLIRAQHTLYEILKRNRRCPVYRVVHENASAWYGHRQESEEDAEELEVFVAEAVNERYYGDLQGMNKDRARAVFGAEQVHIWRRSYDVPPPGGESLEMTAARTLPYYRERIEPRLARGETVLVAAHGNSLRSMIMHIEGMTPEEIIRFELPTGVPYLYVFDEELRLRERRILGEEEETSGAAG